MPVNFFTLPALLAGCFGQSGPKSADGQELKSGTEVWLLSKSTTGANANMDLLTVDTTKSCEADQIGVKNELGSDCVETEYLFVDAGKSMNAVLDGKGISPRVFAYHISD